MRTWTSACARPTSPSACSRLRRTTSSGAELFTVSTTTSTPPLPICRNTAGPSASKTWTNIAILTYGGTAPAGLKRLNWLETAGRENGSPRPAALQVNNVFGLMQGVSRGVGIAVLPDYVAGADPNLVAILEAEEDLPSFETFFVYPEEMKSSKRVTVFRDFLVTKAREWSF